MNEHNIDGQHIYFNESEWSCKCGKPDCTLKGATPHKDLMTILNLIRYRLNQPVKLNSVLRCDKHDIEAKKFRETGKMGSHNRGHAADISLSNMSEATQVDLIKLFGTLNLVGDTYNTTPIITGIGCGKAFIHIDVHEPVRYWSY